MPTVLELSKDITNGKSEVEFRVIGSQNESPMINPFAQEEKEESFIHIDQTGSNERIADKTKAQPSSKKKQQQPN